MNPSANDPRSPAGLPPVTPPSGRFIAQLFLVPGLIVGVAVLFILGLGLLVGGTRSPESYLRDLDSPNADIRWRNASDLAQVLKRPESQALKTDPKFALDLAERLDRLQKELAEAEKNLQDQFAEKAGEKPPWTKLRNLRDQVQFLAASLGDFHVPVGAPLLCELALKDDGPDRMGQTLRRRQAVWALGNLGKNLQDFRKLPPDKQAAAIQLLREEAAGQGARSQWARYALFYLGDGSFPGDNLVKVDHAMARVARAEDRFLRSQVGLTLNFWDGDLVEPTLLELAQDRGQGTMLRITETD